MNSIFQGTTRQKTRVLPYFMEQIEEISFACTNLTKKVSNSLDGVLETTTEILYAVTGLKGISEKLKQNMTWELEEKK